MVRLLKPRDRVAVYCRGASAKVGRLELERVVTGTSGIVQRTTPKNLSASPVCRSLKDTAVGDLVWHVSTASLLYVLMVTSRPMGTGAPSMARSTMERDGLLMRSAVSAPHLVFSVSWMAPGCYGASRVPRVVVRAQILRHSLLAALRLGTSIRRLSSASHGCAGLPHRTSVVATAHLRLGGSSEPAPVLRCVDVCGAEIRYRPCEFAFAARNPTPVDRRQWNCLAWPAQSPPACCSS